MTEKILILDFGSQYTQLIARAVREANVYCEIKPFNSAIVYDNTLKGIILSGSPASVNEQDAPNVDIQAMLDKLPVLTVCYGAQLSAKNFGGKVEKSNKREYGRAQLRIQKDDIIFNNIANNSFIYIQSISMCSTKNCKPCFLRTSSCSHVFVYSSQACFASRFFSLLK